MDALLHGGDYNPEQWLDRPDLLEKDIQYFLKAKINTVTLGVFAWAKLEPAEGCYTFDWLEQIIDRLWENGIGVILATPSGARPRWLAEKYPEVLRVTAERERNLFGMRHNHCLTSPVYRQKVYQIDRELARRFGGHPAVKLWHISNELGGECHCPLCQEAFRSWLKKRYGTIEKLNESWWTTFWSHTYDSFDQVESPSSLGETSVMGLTLDWKRFVSDQLIDLAKEEVRALREGGSDKPTTVNMMYHFGGIDYFRLAEAVDVVSWDSYPVWHKHSDREIAERTAFWHDVIRSLKRKPFLLMESCPAATNWQGVSKLKKPGVVEASALQSIAHGADGALYFQMRQSRGSYEKFHGALIDHYGGDDTRTFREVCGAGAMLESLAEIRGAGTNARAAVLYDWENNWALEGSLGPRNDGLYQEECIEKSYRALRRLGLDVDVIDQSVPLENYRLAAVPMQYLFHDGFADKLKNFVEKGGLLVMTYWSGVVDESDLCFLGETPHGMTEVLGLRREEIDGLYDWEENHICRREAAFDDEDCTGQVLAGMKESYVCKNLCELVKPYSAQTLMTYGEDFYAGYPALLCSRFGEGTAYYVCADAEQEFYDDLYRGLARQADLYSPFEGDIPAGVEVTSRVGADVNKRTVRYLFIQNFSGGPVQLKLPQGKVIYGPGDGKLPNYGGLVLRQILEAPSSEIHTEGEKE